MMIFSSLVYSQQADTTAVQSGENVGDFVDLTGEAVRITIEPEKPRVNIIADRIKPEFDMMDLDRSYIKELTGGGEKTVVLDQKSAFKDEEIDIKKILNKSR
jgi:hypothetical protein